MSVASVKSVPASSDAIVDQEERETVLAAKSGDHAAWKTLYDRYYARVYRHIVFLTHRASIGEDLAQETFVQAMQALPAFEQRAKFSTWLFSISNRVVHKHWRKAGRRARAYEKLGSEPEAPPVHAPEATHLSKERAAALEAALTRIPDKLREAFLLVDVQQLPTDQACERLGISKGNLAVRATRARAKLREELQKDGWLDRETPQKGPKS